MIFKVLGLLLIILGATGVGFLYGEMIKTRLEQLKEVYKSIIFMESEMSYLYTPLPEVFEVIANKSKDPFKEIFKNISELLKEGKVESVLSAFEVSLKKNKDSVYLKEDEIKIIRDFMKNIGESEIQREVNFIKYTKEVIKNKIEELEKEKEVKVKLYRNLGFSAGAIIAIIFCN